MKAVRIHAFGGSDQLIVDDAPVPSVKDDELLVKVRAAGVNPVDVAVREGRAPTYLPGPLPASLGRDFAGEVTHLGAKVDDFAVGDRVFGTSFGSYAEFAVAKASAAAKLPESVDFETAAALPTPGLAAYQLVDEVADVGRDNTVLILGAAGGVGSLAVQLAKLRGARVVAVAAGEDAPYLRSLGADRVIDYKTQRFEELVRDVDVVIDLVGRDTLTRSYPVLKRGALAVTTAGDVDQSEATRFGVRATPFLVRPDAHHLKELARLTAAGMLRPRISRVLPLKEAKGAQELVEKGEAHGKIVLEI
jgi:NADPH:quinone reductase-like Zn-dependent oxidoreductase